MGNYYSSDKDDEFDSMWSDFDEQGDSDDNWGNSDDWDNSEGSSSSDSWGSDGVWGDYDNSEKRDAWGSSTDDSDDDLFSDTLDGNGRTLQHQPSETGVNRKRVPIGAGTGDDGLLDDIEDDSNEAHVENPLTKRLTEKPMGYKGAGIILMVVFLLLAIIFLFVSRIRSKPSTPIQSNDGSFVQYDDVSSDVQQNVGTENQGQVDTGQQGQVNTSQQDSNVSLTKVPDDIPINYSNEVLTGTGNVVGKDVYLINSQLVYRIKLRLKLTDSINEVYYFCSYGVYNSVNLSDYLNVNYQKVSDTVYSVISLEKE